MVSEEAKVKADVLAAKLWRLLGRIDWMKRLSTTQHHADWQTIATAIDRRYLESQIRSQMVRDLCETAKSHLRIKSSDTPYGRDFNVHAWIFDDENMLELLHLAYMQGFDDASGSVMSHSMMVEVQKANG